jgi:hypothetical protein
MMLLLCSCYALVVVSGLFVAMFFVVNRTRGLSD